ncbi:multidrug effflux MFS transporter [Flavihumibacter profundi]|uniref:multidrug effflux MFS transporter n=1 Tax=Flavihumibacter profundi TaxID=2716883 RepID=UPI001CC75854|nr:multidrug effflux MFS transporter [Flavihumibacter profundi]MBZ5857332.1 multidrug effflux MFS transporter [Flavihumibacter profundi]
MQKRNRSLLILILGLLSAIGPFSIDMYLPGFPTIANDLHTSVGYVAYSLSSFFIGICAGQLICGPLLDRFGRKRPLYVGLAIYIVASLGCAMSNSVDLLIGFRFLQALGGCVGMVAPGAIVRDLFPVNENAKIFSMLILILGVSPIIAPTVGSYLIAASGWHAIFILLAIITALILTAVIFLLPESKQPDPSLSLKPQQILNSFLLVLKQPQFFTYAFSGAIAAAGLFAYLAGSPFVFMKIYMVSEKQYGWIFALIAAGLITSSQLNNVLLRKYNSAQIIRVVLLVQTTIGLLLFLGSFFGWLNLYGTIFLIFLFLSCQGFSFPNSSALSLAPFTKEAGSASALMGALQMGFGALASAFVGLINNGTTLPMTGVMAGCALVGLVILILGRKRIEFASRIEDVEEQAFEQIEMY